MSATIDWPRKWRLGVPYQGSKNSIAREIVGILPRGKRFVDLFAGGCAMTHAAMISGKYETFLANDLHGFGVRLFRDAIAGKCNGKWREWVSRDEFMAKRDTDPLVALCWSFGNNQTQYIYGRELEGAKKRETAMALEIGYDAWRKERRGRSGNGNFRQLQHFEELECLERLQGLELLQGLEVSFMSYSAYEHEDGDVVYCDPPYACCSEGNGGYRFLTRSKISFDHAAFWHWVNTRDYPVFVSEYAAPKGFTPIWTKEKCKMMSGKGASGKVAERVFVADRYAAEYQTDLFLGMEGGAR